MKKLIVSLSIFALVAVPTVAFATKWCPPKSTPTPSPSASVQPTVEPTPDKDDSVKGDGPTGPTEAVPGLPNTGHGK